MSYAQGQARCCFNLSATAHMRSSLQVVNTGSMHMTGIAAARRTASYGAKASGRRFDVYAQGTSCCMNIHVC
jgi:hypothetical protein